MAEVMQGERSTIVNFTSSSPLSASWEILQRPLDYVVLSNIREKAVEIATSPGAIQPYCCFSQESKQLTISFYWSVKVVVKTFTLLNVTAASTLCPGFKSLGICSHAVDVNEKQGLLKNILMLLIETLVCISLPLIWQASKTLMLKGRRAIPVSASRDRCKVQKRLWINNSQATTCSIS